MSREDRVLEEIRDLLAGIESDLPILNETMMATARENREMKRLLREVLTWWEKLDADTQLSGPAAHEMGSIIMAIWLHCGAPERG